MTLGNLRKLVLGMAVVAVCFVICESDANAFFGKRCCSDAGNCCHHGWLKLHRCGCGDCNKADDCCEKKADDCCEKKADDCCEKRDNGCCRHRLFRRHRCCCSNNASDGKSDAAPEKADAGA